MAKERRVHVAIPRNDTDIVKLWLIPAHALLHNFLCLYIELLYVVGLSSAPLLDGTRGSYEDVTTVVSSIHIYISFQFIKRKIL